MRAEDDRTLHPADSSPTSVGRAALHLQPGTPLGKYRVERPLGHGGMGRVLLAWDTVLHRRVALKLLDADDAVSAHAQLLHEARNAAALTHPNICAIHEVGEFEGVPFISMEYIEGQTLQAHLGSEGLAFDAVLTYALQAAGALAYAHDRGVIHRDFKAANVIVTADGSLKLVDFGLARRRDVVSSEATTAVTWSLAPGVVAGTPYAMAPEQVRSEPTSTRTDVWALGVLMHEMATGRRPFEGTSVAELFSSILRDPPASTPSALPLAFRSTIGRCLQKDPEQRYKDARAVLVALKSIPENGDEVPVAAGEAPGRFRLALAAIVVVLAAALFVGWQRWSAPPQGSPGRERDARASGAAGDLSVARRSIAILGFDNVSARDDVGYVSTALVQGLGAELVLGDRVRVISAEETSRVRQDLGLSAGRTLGRDTLRKVKSALGADLVLVGSYTAVGRGDGTRVRVDLQVQDAESGEVVGAVSANSAESDLLTLISDNGATVRRVLGIAVNETVRADSTALPATLGARQLYAQGLDALQRFDAKAARDAFERSVAQEPGFALGHVALANAWSVLGFDAQAAQEAATASRLGASLRSEERTWIEGLYREYARDWKQAIGAYQSLVSQHGDEPEYALKLAEAQISAGQARDGLQTLVDIVRRAPHVVEDPRLELARASAFEALGDAPQLEAASRAAIAAANRNGARLLAARASISLARALQLEGDAPGAQRANEEARALFEQAGDRRGVARALIQIGGGQIDAGDLRGAGPTLQTALNIARELGNQRQTAQALNQLANVHFRLRQFAEAGKLYEESVSVSRELGDQGSEARGLGNLANVRYEQGNVAEAQRLDREALAIKRLIGDQRSIAISLFNMAETAVDMGDLPEADRLYAESRTIAESIKAKDLLTNVWIGQAGVALRRDQLDAAQSLVELSLTARTEVADTQGIREARIHLLNILVERNDEAGIEKVRTELESQADSAPPEQAAQFGLISVGLLERSGALDESRRLLSSITRRSREGYSESTNTAIELANARLTATAGSRRDAIAAVQRTVQRLRSRGLAGMAFDAELELLKLQQRSPAAQTDLVTRARAAQFSLIARKAEAVGTSVVPRTARPT